MLYIVKQLTSSMYLFVKLTHKTLNCLSVLSNRQSAREKNKVPQRGTSKITDRLYGKTKKKPEKMQG